MKYTVRKSIIDVVGEIWMPAVVCSQRINLSGWDVANIKDRFDGEITRETVEDWLSRHSGDFQSIIDFSASIDAD